MLEYLATFAKTGTLALCAAALSAPDVSAQASRLYMLSVPQFEPGFGTTYVYQGGQQTGSYAHLSDGETAVAILGGTVRQVSYGFGNGTEYRPDGTPTGTTYRAVSEAYDGTSDGTSIWAWSWFTAQLNRYDAQWNYLGTAFSLGPAASRQYMGITYDPTNNSIWLAPWGFGAAPKLMNYSLSGTFLGAIDLASPSAQGNGLAYDRADDTFWFFNWDSQRYEQYARSGSLLSTMTGMTRIYGAEFLSAVPEPATRGLMLLGMLAWAVAAARGRRRSRRGRWRCRADVPSAATSEGLRATRIARVRALHRDRPAPRRQGASPDAVARPPAPAAHVPSSVTPKAAWPFSTRAAVVAAALLATAASAAPILSSGSLVGPVATIDFSQYVGPAQVEGANGPIQVGGLIGRNVVVADSSATGNIWLYNGTWSFLDNGTWNDGRAGYLGLFPAAGPVRIRFTDGPVAGFGMFMNYIPSDPRYSTPTIKAFDASGAMLEMFDIARDAPISTPNGRNAGAFRGIQLSTASIAYVEFFGSGSALDNLVFTVPSAVPEPNNLVLICAGAVFCGLLRSRGRRGPRGCDRWRSINSRASMGALIPLVLVVAGCAAPLTAYNDSMRAIYVRAASYESQGEARARVNPGEAVRSFQSASDEYYKATIAYNAAIDRSPIYLHLADLEAPFKQALFLGLVSATETAQARTQARLVASNARVAALKEASAQLRSKQGNSAALTSASNTPRVAVAPPRGEANSEAARRIYWSELRNAYASMNRYGGKGAVIETSELPPRPKNADEEGYARMALICSQGFVRTKLLAACYEGAQAERETCVEAAKSQVMGNELDGEPEM